jgi:hypothetical protein
MFQKQGFGTKMQAVGACMRKLVMLCDGVLKNREPFDPQWADDPPISSLDNMPSGSTTGWDTPGHTHSQVKVSSLGVGLEGAHDQFLALGLGSGVVRVLEDPCVLEFCW